MKSNHFLYQLIIDLCEKISINDKNKKFRKLERHYLSQDSYGLIHLKMKILWILKILIKYWKEGFKCRIYFTYYSEQFQELRKCWNLISKFKFNCQTILFSTFQMARNQLKQRILISNLCFCICNLQTTLVYESGIK